MENERQYIVDYTVGKSSGNPNPSPIILDLDTGADQQSSQWDEALHQFLQLKHGCKLSPQSLKGVFISNVTFIKMYGSNMYGLSGTLGSQQEQQEAIKIYSVDFMIVPTFKTKLFAEIKSELCTTHESWIQKLSKITSEAAKSRAVLIICETIRDVNQIAAGLKSEGLLSVTTLRREADGTKIEKLEKGQVVVATNLAGRGMDLKLSDEVKRAGGLHVLVSYLPSNTRIENQAFGRAARAGDSGTGQLCIVSKHASIYELKQQRNIKEIERLGKVHQYYKNFISIEEEFFNEFNLSYQNLAGSEGEAKIFKENFLINWSFWLDTHSMQIEDSTQENRDKLVEALKIFMAKNCSNKGDWSGDEIHRTSRVLFTIHNKDKPQDNVKLLKRGMEKEPEICFAEKYYKLFYALQDHKDSDCIKKSLTPDHIDAMRNLIGIFEARKDARALRAEMLNPFTIKNKRSLVQIENASTQQSTYNQIDDVFINSINALIGPPIYPETFGDGDLLQNPTEDFVNELISLGVLKSARMVNQIPAEKVEEIALSNLVLPKVISALVDSLKGEAIKVEDLANRIAKEVSAPSREQFWDILIKEEILTNAVEYVTFNMLTLKTVDPSFLKYLELKEVKSQRVILNEEAALEQGKLDDVIFIYKPTDKSDNTYDHQLTFRSSFLPDDSRMKIIDNLKAKECLTTNKRATFNKVKAESWQFKVFNTLHLEDFQAFNIGETAAINILENLEKASIIKKNPRSGYSLIKTFADFDSIDLKENEVYTHRLLQLLSYSFPYQIALQKLLSNSSGNIVIQLPVNPTCKSCQAFSLTT